MNQELKQLLESNDYDGVRQYIQDQSTKHAFEIARIEANGERMLREGREQNARITAELEEGVQQYWANLPEALKQIPIKKLHKATKEYQAEEHRLYSKKTFRPLTIFENKWLEGTERHHDLVRDELERRTTIPDYKEPTLLARIGAYFK